MSNHWIEWTCIDCERRVLIHWIVAPGWPSGLVDARVGWCEACFKSLHERPRVVPEHVAKARERAFARLLRLVYKRVQGMEGTPTERFLALGLDDESAQRAADEFSKAKHAADTYFFDQLDKHRRAMVDACLVPGFSMLTDDEHRLLHETSGAYVTFEYTEWFMPRDYSRIPASLTHPVPPPAEGEHGLFYVLPGNQIAMHLPG